MQAPPVLPEASGGPLRDAGSWTGRPPPRPFSPSPPVEGIPASAADTAAARLASSSCLCRCSSMDTRSAWGGKGAGQAAGAPPTPCPPLPARPQRLLTRASSGSALGSTPNSKSLAPSPSMAPPSPARIGELMRASARLGPGGTVTRWDPVPSLLLRVLMKAVSLSVLASCGGGGRGSRERGGQEARRGHGPDPRPRAAGAQPHLFPEIDDVHVHLLLLQALGQLHQLQGKEALPGHEGEGPRARGGDPERGRARTVGWGGAHSGSGPGRGSPPHSAARELAGNPPPQQKPATLSRAVRSCPSSEQPQGCRESVFPLPTSPVFTGGLGGPPRQGIATPPLRTGTHVFLVVLHGAPDKGDDPHLVVLALPMLQSQLEGERRVRQGRREPQISSRPPPSSATPPNCTPQDLRADVDGVPVAPAPPPPRHAPHGLLVQSHGGPRT